jgi:glutamate/tyrosine decarboxylase-like PLP-dependent enzyme
MTRLDALKTLLLEQSQYDFDDNTTLVKELILEGNIHNQQSWAAHMTPSIDSPALLGQLLAGLHNGNLLSVELYPQLARIEKQLIDWFCQLFQHKQGHFTHGGTYANLEALWQAREQTQSKSTLVYGSQDSHYSIPKACRILGLQFKSIATNERGELSIEALRHACQQQPPLAIVATAGTSSCGAIDSIIDCVELANAFSCWCHIDAAWGGALILTSYASLLKGIGDANSVSFDPHKALSQPRPCGLLLYQQSLDSFSDINYLMHDPKQTLPGSYGGELFLPLWLSLSLSGKQALINQIESRLQQASTLYETLNKQTDWWTLLSPTGMVCFKPSNNYDFSPLIQQGIISEIKMNNRFVYRAVFASDKTQASGLFAALKDYF